MGDIGNILGFGLSRGMAPNLEVLYNDVVMAVEGFRIIRCPCQGTMGSPLERNPPRVQSTQIWSIYAFFTTKRNDGLRHMPYVGVYGRLG